MALTREQILAARRDRRPVPYEVEEWGGTVFLKYLTVDDQMELSEHNSGKEMPVAVLMASVCDEEGTPLFLPGDEAELGKESFSVVLKVFSASAKLNGLTTTELDEAMASFGVTLPGAEATGSGSLSASENSEISPVGS